jgi:hypothetical protein
MKRNTPLTLEQVTERLIVDCNAGRCFWRDPSKHHPDLVGKEAGGPRAGHCKDYWVIKIGGVAYKRAQIILFVATGEWPSDCVDHINGNSTDDRAVNLRHATPTQNAWNHRSRAKQSSLPMGVRRTRLGRFQARIGYKKRQISVGVFDTVAEAQSAYINKRKELFNDFCGM